MTIYAVADTVPEGKPWWEAGKEYEVTDDDGVTFKIDGNLCLWQGCAHLNGGSWRRIERDDAPTNATPDIPDWAYERAAQELNDVYGTNRWSAGYDKECEAMRAVANLIAKHEQTPSDPDEDVVKAVIEAWVSHGVHWSLCPDDLARAIAVYKAHKALDTPPNP